MCIQYTRSMCILHVYVTNALNPLKFLSASVHEKWESIQSDDVEYLHGISFWSVMLHSKLRVYRQIVSLLNEDNETRYRIVTSLVYVYKRHYLQHCLHFQSTWRNENTISCCRTQLDNTCQTSVESEPVLYFTEHRYNMCERKESLYWNIGLSDKLTGPGGEQ